MRRQIIAASLTLLFCVSLFALTAHAAVVGRFTQVNGQVDLLKAGKIPALAAKYLDGVEPGDVIRTKTKSKAQLSMIDDSIITLAPESRLAIADYQYNPARQDRRAVLRLFRGMMQTVVSRIIKTEEPNFIIETHTATIGVRGSNPYFLLMPGFTSVYLPLGLLEVSSNNPAIPYQVTLGNMQFTQIPLGKQPFLPQAMTPAMLQTLAQMMNTGITPDMLYTGPSTGVAGTAGAQFPLRLPVSPDQVIMQQTIPPQVVPQHQIPAPAPAPVQPAPYHPSGGSSISVP